VAPDDVFEGFYFSLSVRAGGVQGLAVFSGLAGYLKAGSASGKTAQYPSGNDMGEGHSG
jgi:hypothetical protein